MLPNEVKSAIPRQKVRHVPSGAIGDVIAPQEKHGLVDDVVPGVSVFTKDRGVQVWALECCEPVPEEPRGFRVGDKVVLNGTWFCTITATYFYDGYTGFRVSTGMDCSPEQLRHATPEELKLHF